MATISVIVPVYKVEKYIHRCVDSILAQTFTDFELILVDDGSPDNCGAICDEYVAKDSRIIVIHQENGGQAAARNRGIEYALSYCDSDWICFIDSDDWVNKTYLEGLYQAAFECECPISVCDFVKDESEIKTICRADIHHISPMELYNDYFYIVQSPWCKLFSKELFLNSEYRFPEGILYEDSALIYKIVFSQEQIAFTNYSTYYYFQRPDSSMNANWNPKRMVYCQVQREQFEWLLDHHYETCARTCLCRYLGTLHYNASLIQSVPEYRKYARTMRRICREMLRKYAKRYDLTVGKHPQFYEAGYPHLMAIYWVIKAQADKLKAGRRMR